MSSHLCHSILTSRYLLQQDSIFGRKEVSEEVIKPLHKLESKAAVAK